MNASVRDILLGMADTLAWLVIVTASAWTITTAARNRNAMSDERPTVACRLCGEQTFMTYLAMRILREVRPTWINTNQTFNE